MEELGRAAPAAAERHRHGSGPWAAQGKEQEGGGAIPARGTPQHPPGLVPLPPARSLPLLLRAAPGPHVGGPGSGKGSQCKQLAKKYGFTHLSASDLLQNELSSLSERSKFIKDIVECGDPVPGGIVLELLKEAMVSKLGDTKGFLIHGYPQELKDAEEFESKIGEPRLVLCLECSAETMSSRLLVRNQSTQSSENSETTEERIESYYQASNPLIAYYESKTQLCKVHS